MVLFAYNRDIPDAPNNPSVDQPDMFANTNAIDDIIAVDHYSFNTPTGGIHKQVTLINEAAPGLGDGNGVLYANLVSSQSWPFWQNALGSVQLIGGIPVSGNNGYVYLPGGLILQWGQVTSTIGNAFQTLTFSTNNIAFPNNCFSVFTQPYGSGSIPGSQATVDVRKSTINKLSFQWVYITNSGDYTGFYWAAIGN